jgi:hypothetical protein
MIGLAVSNQGADAYNGVIHMLRGVVEKAPGG